MEIVQHFLVYPIKDYYFFSYDGMFYVKHKLYSHRQIDNDVHLSNLFSSISNIIICYIRIQVESKNIDVFWLTVTALIVFDACISCAYSFVNTF